MPCRDAPRRVGTRQSRRGDPLGGVLNGVAVVCGRKKKCGAGGVYQNPPAPAFH
jgi:hypothetical protein